MTTILIADDEQIERDALELMASRSGLELRCLKARNGQEAVKLVSENQVGIAILDIKMPVMDGLEAARIIAEISPSTILVFLTAWGSFDYAQEAIRLGAEDYLVKPCDNDTFIALMRKCLERIDKQVPQKDIQAMMNIFTREFFTALKYESLSDDAIKAFLRLKGIRTEKGIAMVISSSSRAELEAWWMHNDLLKSVPSCYYSGLDRMLILAFIDNPRRIEAQMSIFAEDHDECFIGLGEGFKGINEFAKALHTASIAYMEAMRTGRKVVSFRPGMHRSSVSMQASINMIMDAIKARSLNEALSESHRVVDDIVSRYGNGQEACDSLYELILVLSHEVSSSIANLAFPSPSRGSMAEMDTYMTDLIQAGCEALIMDSKDKYGRAFEQIKSFIQDHYSENLCSADVASLFQISASYFPKLFKERMGMPFVEYLTTIRMQEALKLLEKGLTVKEVANRIGFDDSNYFARVFRQTFHRSPKAVKLNLLSEH